MNWRRFFINNYYSYRNNQECNEIPKKNRINLNYFKKQSKGLLKILQTESSAERIKPVRRSFRPASSSKLSFWRCSSKTHFRPEYFPYFPFSCPAFSTRKQWFNSRCQTRTLYLRSSVLVFRSLRLRLHTTLRSRKQAVHNSTGHVLLFFSCPHHRNNFFENFFPNWVSTGPARLRARYS